MNKFLYLTIISLLLTTPVSMASYKSNKNIKQCTKQKSVAKASQCLDTIIEKTDRELQTWVNNQTFNLEELAIKTGRKSALSLFKRSQSDFMNYRENNCRWQYLAISPDIHAGNAYKKCYILVSRDRIKELSHVAK
ncbi:MAG: DUF1311 domain-containing protein [Alteromonadaceae bacterium]|nr:DUF1311 domain-containing protein [Alteromonadaceae bacterium]